MRKFLYVFENEDSGNYYVISELKILTCRNISRKNKVHEKFGNFTKIGLIDGLQLTACHLFILFSNAALTYDVVIEL